MSDIIVDSTDAVVIGAGAVGLFSVFACGMRKLRCHVIDTLEDIGGQLTTLYPEKPIFDIPGHPHILAADLITKLEKQTAPFHPIFHLGQRVERLQRQTTGAFLVTTIKGTRITCRVIIIAAGVGAFHPNRPPLPGLETFEGRSVFYMVRRREDFRGRRVVIAGGGDSAVDWALSLINVAARVTVVHRRPKFRAAPDSTIRLQQLAQAGQLDLVIPYQLHSLEGHDGWLSAVIVTSVDGHRRRLEADALLSLFGLVQELGPIASWGLSLEQNHITINQATSMTSEQGIFAVGDIATYPGKLKLLLTGFAEAARAAHSAYTFVYPDKALHFAHSTTTGVPEFVTHDATP
ncbi:Thioredoxin reductase [invertebrate metagenome]|uniref:Thioredoxin reductase n=1 Tax=invertebrate metagenome TaxID=1711999 RepID=A0A484H7R4_9ZZZZ